MALQKVKLWKKIHMLYAFFFVRKVLAHIVTFVFYCAVIPATVLVPEVDLPFWGAVYIPSIITILNAISTPKYGYASFYLFKIFGFCNWPCVLVMTSFKSLQNKKIKNFISICYALLTAKSCEQNIGAGLCTCWCSGSCLRMSCHCIAPRPLSLGFSTSVVSMNGLSQRSLET